MLQGGVMSNIHNIDKRAKRKSGIIADDEKRLGEASDWIAKLDRKLTGNETKSLQAWLALTPKNVAVLFEVAQLWDKMDDLSRLSDLFPQTSVQNRKTPKWLSAMAASIVLAVSIGFYQSTLDLPFFGQTEPSAVVAMQMSYQTNTGESNIINLPDNSKIVLNTNSFVQIKYTKHARIIELQRGEIHIDVAHDTSRPLSVIAGGKVIQAVGTAFNVEVQSKLVELIVTDGKVLVAQKPTLSAYVDLDKIAKKLPSSAMAISKGEKIELDLIGPIQEKVTKVDVVDIATSLSWRQGNLIFRGESLAETLAEISRYTDIEFEISDDQQLKQVQVAGMFKTGDVIGLLDVLTTNFSISYKKTGKNKIFLEYSGS
jgi:transmembrane sensor